MDDSKFISELSSVDILTIGDLTETESFLDKCGSITQSTSVIQQSVTSLDTNSDEDLNEVRILKRKISLLEDKCKRLEEDNEAITKELCDEKVKLGKMKTKLEFVKDNQDVFVQLKEAYMNMKYNQTTGKKLVKVKESGVQTYQGILCRACIKTEELRRSLDVINQTYEGGIVLTKEQVDGLTKTTFFIREMIQKQDKYWTSNLKRQLECEDYIKSIEQENDRLKDALKNNLPINVNRISSATITDMDLSRKEIHFLKKIVIKLYGRYREVLQKSGVDQKTLRSLELESKELNIVEQLVQKCAQKLRSRREIGQKSKKIGDALSSSASVSSDIYTKSGGQFLQEKGDNCSTNDVSLNISFN